MGMTTQQTIYSALNYREAKSMAQLMRETGFAEDQIRRAIDRMREKQCIFVAQVGGSNDGWYLSGAPLPPKGLGKTRWKVGPPPYPKRSARP